MYDIACRPELVKELRAEIESVVGECDGVMSTQALYKMRLLDSVMKESQRVNPLGFGRSSLTHQRIPSLHPGTVGFPRQTIKGIKLSDGTYIPPNVSIEALVEAIGNDNAVWDDAETFDPYRFYRLRQNGGENANRHQFVTLGKGVLSFGYGKHGCPGRFFAANEIKLLVIGIIRKFDVKTIGGERYENLEHGISVSILSASDKYFVNNEPDCRTRLMLGRNCCFKGFNQVGRVIGRNSQSFRAKNGTAGKISIGIREIRLSEDKNTNLITYASLLPILHQFNRDMFVPPTLLAANLALYRVMPGLLTL